MKIRHERPMSDLSFQVRAPLGLELATGEAVSISTWSLKGVEFPGDRDVMPKEAVLSIPFQGVDIRFPVRLEREGDGRFLAFSGLTGRQRETLAVFYRSILSGKMASTEDVITSLDTPVDLVPMDETEEERAAGMAGKTPRSLRAAFAVCLYLVIAGLVLWTLGSGIYGKVATVEIRNARAEAALVPLTVPDSGYVESVRAAPGERVAAGTLLIEISTPEDIAAIAELRGRIELLEARLEDAIAREARLATRIARDRAALVEAIAAAAPDRRAGAAAALDAFDGGYSAAHRDLFDAHGEVLGLIDALDDELRRLRRERGDLKDAAEALHVVAPVDGLVSEVLVQDGQLLARGATAVVLEEDVARQARGWLPASMSRALFVGMEVRARLRTADGPKVVTGRIATLEAAIDPDYSAEFGMLVTVDFPGIDAEESRSLLLHHMPLDLRADRAWAVRLAARVDALFGHEEGQP